MDSSSASTPPVKNELTKESVNTQALVQGKEPPAFLSIEHLQRLYSSSFFHTLLLFTWTDYKTIFIPITSFACATAPVYSPYSFLQGCAWIWIHLVLCNVSNQAKSIEEDAINRPWRPLPSGRMTPSQATILRWTMAGICLLWSAAYGLDMVAVTLGLILTTFFYDEANLASHPIGKNLCNVGGYTSFEMGATKMMGYSKALDPTSASAVILSGILIFTTIQAQDFPDVEGDAASGRITLPIYAPNFSRIFTLCVIPFWSCLLGWFWGIGPLALSAYVALGLYVGVRYFVWRSQDIDQRTYLIFNVWLMLVHLLPLHARTGVLGF